MMCLALVGNCGAFGASGESDTSAAEAGLFCDKRAASPSMPKPTPVCCSASRRVMGNMSDLNGWGVSREEGEGGRQSR